ncbi:GIY-YIG nuclease family protein [Aureivirga marina]|uniref:GIY-YIG nuclease family protein n=1 Tax=Aureivirga marina TaxID=1182451 RepID=UPI0018C9E4EC|nr:GIY-YIG nuclease family protein [Aureivirga marina]
MSIKLNDLLHLENLSNVKIKLNVSNGHEDPFDLYKNKHSDLLAWQFWNRSKKIYKVGQIAIGLVRIKGNKWLLFDISRITKDLNIFEGVGYEYETIKKYEKYFGRLIIHFENNAQQMARKAESIIDDCFVSQILEDTYDEDLFPGYENVNLSWKELKRVLNKNTWKTALENQKGIYLITDKSNGKKYVGAAYGNSMLHGRWSNYIYNGHGGNTQLKKLDIEHIKEHFSYSILDIFKSTVDDKIILNRETFWKRTLLTRDFGYNSN